MGRAAQGVAAGHVPREATGKAQSEELSWLVVKTGVIRSLEGDGDRVGCLVDDPTHQEMRRPCAVAVCERGHVPVGVPAGSG